MPGAILKGEVMKELTTRLLADKLTGGCVSGLARLLGLNISTVKRMNSGESQQSPVVELLLSAVEVLSSRIGNEAARELFIEAARRLGRKPDDLRDFRK